MCRGPNPGGGGTPTATSPSGALRSVRMFTDLATDDNRGCRADIHRSNPTEDNTQARLGTSSGSVLLSSETCDGGVRLEDAYAE